LIVVPLGWWKIARIEAQIASILTFDLIDPMDALSLFRWQYFLNTDLVN
jgi:hypothetical protein